MRRIGTKLVASKKAEVLASTNGHGVSGNAKDQPVVAVGKQDVKGRDLLSLLIKSNMAGDLTEGERMSEEEILAREC